MTLKGYVMASRRFHKDGSGAVVSCEGCARCTSPAPIVRPRHAAGFIGPVRVVSERVDATAAVAWLPVRRLPIADVKALTGSCPEAILIRRPPGKTYQKSAGSDPAWARKWSKNGTTGVTSATPSSRLADRAIPGKHGCPSLSSLMSEPQAADGGN